VQSAITPLQAMQMDEPERAARDIAAALLSF
jgi:hypothetical protein